MCNPYDSTRSWVLSGSLNVFDYYLLCKSASIWTTSWFPFCLHIEAKITDIILITGETIFYDSITIF